MDEELKRKLLFTLLVLVIYRIGAHIAAPGVNVTALADFIRNSAAAGFFGLYDALGGGLSRATVFALGIMPYISASIIFQLAGGVAPSIGKMQKDEEGKKRITQWTRYLTVFIALSQAYTFALFTESIPGAVPSPGFASRLIMVVMITAGVMPIIFAQTIIIVPGTLASFTQNAVLQDLAGFFNPGDWPYNLTFAAMILVFSYFYTSIIFNSVDLAENLKKQGGFIPGVKPGASTADYIDGVLARITLPGGLFLAGIAILPILVSTWFNIPNSGFGGTSVLIVVGVLLDTIAQVEQHRTLRKYDGFMKTGRVKFRGRQQRYI